MYIQEENNISIFVLIVIFFYVANLWDSIPLASPLP